MGEDLYSTRMGGCAGTEDLGGGRGFILRGVLGERRIFSVRGELCVGRGREDFCWGVSAQISVFCLFFRRGGSGIFCWKGKVEENIACEGGGRFCILLSPTLCVTHP